MLEFDRVSVSHRGRTILHEVSFALRPHRITVLLGRNGSGKSTLIRCVNGLQRYTGEIRLDGVSLALTPPRERARKIGILPQILPDTALRVGALAALGRNPYVDTAGRLSPEDRRMVSEALRSAGMEDFADRSLRELSGGERQRAFLAMLLAQNTRILLMDEPTTYLDVDARRELRELIRTLARKQKKTLLVVLHDLNEALELADDVVILENGELRFCGDVQACLDAHALEDCFHVIRRDCLGGGAFFQ
ncbi:MAG: ABC transporter ATP-binding protein [Clostridia bacterium]|nr:ABC transporter ATP-binding protein [Clostridia bacterium]